MSGGRPVIRTPAARGAEPALAGPRPYMAMGFLVVAVLAGAVGAWATTAEISGAVVASGVVVVDSNVKKVQHPTGGVIATIAVREGDAVQAGDLLVRLDETLTRANLQVVTRQLDEIAVRQTRLTAELEGASTLAFPDALEARRGEPHIAEIMRTERVLFESRRDGRDGLKSQLSERIAQLRQEVVGLEAQERAKARELKLAEAELAGLETLEDRNLVATTRITAARRLVAQLEGDFSQVVAKSAQVRGKIAETELQILQLDQDMKSEVGKELRDQQARVAELSERRIAAEDQLRRVDIRAPQSGTVHQLAVHTVGGVIAPSEEIMLIVPNADRLVIDAKVAPQDIDQVRAGQVGRVRFSAFNQRTTPDMAATVRRVSADLLVDPAAGGERAPTGGLPYYSVRLELTEEGRKALGDLELVPGMPAEVHITTEQRTALSYFAKPLTDQFARAFRER